MSIVVIKGAPGSTVQDGGRTGYRRHGVAVGGAVDRHALGIANTLVGNAPFQPGLELVLSGPTLCFQRPALIAITGADLSPSLDDLPLPLWRPIAVAAGSILGFGERRWGCRAYLAVAGGLDLPSVLGGRGTDVRAGFGGVEGRSIKHGDRLELGTASSLSNHILSTLPLAAGHSWRGATYGASRESLQIYRHRDVVRVLPGMDFGGPYEAAMKLLHEAKFRVARESDRMGLRLEGATLPSLSEIMSQPVAPGAIQLPPDGNPIVLMADAGTTGGYPIIAHVASVDMPKLAQLIPDDDVSFHPITLDEAIRLRRDEEHAMAMMELAVRTNASHTHPTRNKTPDTRH